jgi:hypothetical protein
VPCGDRRLQRESARKAPIGEHRHLAAAQRTAEQHGDDGAVAQALKQLSAISDQLSVVFLVDAHKSCDLSFRMCLQTPIRTNFLVSAQIRG